VTEPPNTEPLTTAYKWMKDARGRAALDAIASELERLRTPAWDRLAAQEVKRLEAELERVRLAHAGTQATLDVQIQVSIDVQAELERVRVENAVHAKTIRSQQERTEAADIRAHRAVEALREAQRILVYTRRDVMKMPDEQRSGAEVQIEKLLAEIEESG
jgi:hypothetical protein